MGEYELFRAVYCGVCRSMGRHTGLVSRFTLSYDYVFLAAVRMVLTDTVPTCVKRHCIAHPLKKRHTAEENPSLAYTASAAACMLSEKLHDDSTDESGFKRLLARAGQPFACGMIRRAGCGDELPFGDKPPLSPRRIGELTARLYEMEAAGATSVDETAEAFGDVLAYVFACGLDECAAHLAEEIGRAAGRFVYICDAADDLTSDIKKGRYNPIARSWGAFATEERDGRCVMSSLTAESVRIATRIDLEKLGQAVERLPSGNPLLPIIKNIVYLGMPGVMDGILGKSEEAHDHKE